MLANIAASRASSVIRKGMRGRSTVSARFLRISVQGQPA